MAVLTSTGITFSDATTQASAYIGTRGQVFTSSGTYTVPTGVTSAKVTVVGGGGSGGDATGTSSAAGGGGGAVRAGVDCGCAAPARGKPQPG